MKHKEGEKMKKKIIVSISIIIALLIIVGIIAYTKPAFIGDAKDCIQDKWTQIQVKNSSKYKEMKNIDHTKEYYKTEKEIQIPILLYHEVLPEVKNRADYHLIVSGKQFEKQIKGLLDYGYRFITYEELDAYNKGKLALPEKVVLISFDDGHIGNYENAFGIATKYKVPISIFVVDSFIGTEGYFTWDQAREMDKSGYVHLYLHGKDHIPYNEGDPAKAANDIDQAFNHLEQELGHSTLKVFAYPYGDYDDEIVWALYLKGYIQNTTIPETNKTSTLDMTRLRRIYVKQTYSPEKILECIL